MRGKLSGLSLFYFVAGVCAGFGVERGEMSGKAVRSRSEFGQVWWGKQKSCQEKLGIVTGLVGKAEKLSRKARNCDRFGGGSRKAVKKSSEIVTGLVGEAEKLSRKARDCDRFGGGSGKAVKKSSEL